jgi:hypothetical protein
MCFASAAPAPLRHLLEQQPLAHRVVTAFTAADAIAQAELELRLFPPFQLFKVEPLDGERHHKLLLGPVAESWAW